ncbi:MAG: trypsin-like peptidase domain-containing protein [Betaproteobacteria bacterium]|nr:trypsin-like peptidase domain-containing protein [Betaproteobacteria bacterium]
MRKRFPVVVLLSFLSLPAVAVDYAAYGKVAASVVRVVARIPNTNSTSFGSGVVLPDGRVVTNCHVIPGAGKVVVMEGAVGTEVERGPSDLAADLCVLHPIALTTPPAQTATAHTLEVGDEVVAIGFGGGGGRSISSGRVTALYPYRNGQVIQTTAAFRQGASGGGLFDRRGNLVGITTFFRRSGAESAFFAIPVEWIDALTSSDVESESRSNPFWMRPQGDQPLFLQVASYEADGKWAEMEAAARLWTQEEPGQMQSWEALSRALMALGGVMEGGTARLRAKQASESARTSIR